MLKHHRTDYRHPVRIERRGEDQDDYSNIAETWDEVITVSAAIRTLSRREQSYAQQIGQYVTHEIRMRYYPGIDSKDRLVLINTTGVERVIGIVSIVDVDENHEELLITAAERV